MCRVLLAHNTYKCEELTQSYFCALFFSHDSQQYLFSAVRQEFYLETLLERLDKDPQAVLARVERLYKSLTEPTNPATLRILTDRKSLHTQEDKGASMEEADKNIDEPLLKPLIAAMEGSTSLGNMKAQFHITGHAHGPCALEQNPPSKVQSQFGKHSITAIGASESSFIYAVRSLLWALNKARNTLFTEMPFTMSRQ